MRLLMLIALLIAGLSATQAVAQTTNASVYGPVDPSTQTVWTDDPTTSLQPIFDASSIRDHLKSGGHLQAGPFTLDIESVQTIQTVDPHKTNRINATGTGTSLGTNWSVTVKVFGPVTAGWDGSTLGAGISKRF